MRNKRLLLIYFSILLILISSAICIWLCTILKPELTVIQPGVSSLGDLVCVIWAILLILQLVLLKNSIACIKSPDVPRLRLSFCLVLLPVSAILCVWDFLLLTDIANEYLIWDVTEEWLLLLVNHLIHFAALISTLLLETKTAAKTDRMVFNDTPFHIVHQTGLICSLSGIVLLIVSQLGIIHITERFADLWIFYIGLILMLPFFVLLTFCLISRGKGGLRAAVDEKQISDIQKSGLSASILTFVILLILAFLNLFLHLSLSLMFWIWVFLFIILGIYCASALRRNRIR